MRPVSAADERFLLFFSNRPRCNANTCADLPGVISSPSPASREGSMRQLQVK